MAVDVFGRWAAPQNVRIRMHSSGVLRQEGELLDEVRYAKQKVKVRIGSFFRGFAQNIYIGMVMRFSAVAAKYTPPNIGKANIDSKYYYRPIYDLVQLAQGLVRTERGRRVYATREDFAALRAGFKFKVVNTKFTATREQRRRAFAYTKGINEAKRLARIQNRGLSKYSWGANLNNTKEDLQNYTGENFDRYANESGEEIGLRIYKANNLPPIFKRLAAKSPQMTRFTWGYYNKKILPNSKKVQRININILNRLTQIQRYAYIAIRKGVEAADKFATTIWKAVGPMAQFEGYNPAELPQGYLAKERIAAEKLRQKMNNLFNDDIKKYGVQQLRIRRTYKGQQIVQDGRIKKDINILFK